MMSEVPMRYDAAASSPILAAVYSNNLVRQRPAEVQFASNGESTAAQKFKACREHAAAFKHGNGENTRVNFMTKTAHSQRTRGARNSICVLQHYVGATTSTLTWKKVEDTIIFPTFYGSPSAQKNATDGEDRVFELVSDDFHLDNEPTASGKPTAAEGAIPHEKYECGYCGSVKASTSAGSDGRVRIRCECGGKHGDGKSRMHAKWILFSESPDNQDAISVDTFCSEQSTSPTGDTDDVPEAKAPKRRALMASHPYHR